MMKTLNLNNEIYDLNAIKSTIITYRQLCDIRIASDTRYFILTIDNCRYDEELTTKEFCNAVLIETIRKKGSLYD